MNDNYVNFKKQRELGAILTDTFKFIRLEWRPLGGMILKYAGPALLIVIFAYIYYMQTTLGNLGLLNTAMDFGAYTAGIFIALLLLLVSGLAFYALLYGTIIHYVKIYIANNGVVDKKQVAQGIKKDFWRLFGLTFLVGIMAGIGLLLCVIPGIYLGTILASTYAILVIERRGISDSISYSFDLIRGEWWITFATYLVIFLLFYLITFVFNIPQYIYFFVQTFVRSQEISADPTAMFDWIYFALNGIALLAQYLLHSLIVIATVLVYYNLNEKKHLTGTMETIDNLGKQQ
ncbi:hypothetical protein MG296_06910 [Flavobacteriaceae bacterium TK19130]|nr:hypothetical protein [Thermobacterium salinum]